VAGYGGTSAGAIVAALAATGYSPDELYSYHSGKGILDKLDKDTTNNDIAVTKCPVGTPTRLLGKAWNQIRILRWIINHQEALKFLVVAIFGVYLLAGAALFPVTTVFSIFGLVVLAFWGIRRAAKGFVSLEMVRFSLNQLFRMKLRKKRTGEDITFQDLADANCPPLRIVAANISKNELTLFSAETTPEVCVADAVCASICLPIVFVPHRIDGCDYLDGGLLSNLPAWVFDDERSCDRDALTAAIQIEKKPITSEGAKPLGRIASAFKTMLVGTDPLNKRGVEKLTATTLAVALGLLDFDLTKAEAEELLTQSEGYCRADLIKRMIELPNEINGVCEIVARRCTKAICNAHKIVGIPNYDVIVRVAVGIPSPLGKSIKIEFSSGYDQLTDERLRLPFETSLMGEALVDGTSVYAASQDTATWNRYLNRPEDRWTKKLLWQDLKWVLCIPIEIAPSKRLVISVDGNEPLSLNDADLQALLDSLEQLIYAEFGFLKEVEKELPDGS
jgi:NTE family protein